MSTSDRPAWITKRVRLWLEDDAERSDHNTLGAAWTRLFGTEAPDSDHAIATVDEGDSVWCLYAGVPDSEESARNFDDEEDEWNSVAKYAGHGFLICSTGIRENEIAFVPAEAMP